jgi:hypothetical protein
MGFNDGYTLSTVFNGNNLGTINIGGKTDTSPTYTTGTNVYGRVYAIVLALVYQNTSLPEVQKSLIISISIRQVQAILLTAIWHGI